MQQALVLFCWSRTCCVCPQLDGGDALWAEQGDGAVLVVGWGGVPISSIHAVEGLAVGNGVTWEDGNAKEQRPTSLAAPADPRVARLIPASSGPACTDCTAGTLHVAGGWCCTEMALCVCVCACLCLVWCAWVWLGLGTLWLCLCVWLAVCPLRSQRAWPVPKRRTWASTRSWTRPCWS